GLLGLGLIWLLTLIVLAICGVGFGGWMIVLAGGCVLTALILLALGVMGEYIARIYDEAKDRPVYIIDSIIEKEEES
ncbi:MAG: glycosyltransferase, partial [Eubacteriales bacterium]|nr:glycosyltransferase [Eubacteriales bacterium]